MIQNAKIESTMLGYEGHGIMTFYLYLDYGGSGQGFGGYALDAYDQRKKKRVGHKSFGEAVAEILRVVGVEKWEDLKGQFVRVEYPEGWNQTITGIGHVLEDKWFRPKEFFSSPTDTNQTKET